MKSSPRLSILVSAAALAVLAAAQTASATDGRYREYVVGERAGGMGGAAIAVARDVDAIYYNPAGLSHSSGDSISLSANLYGIESYKTSHGLDMDRSDTSSSFVSIPGAMGGILRLSDEWVGGVGVFTPKQEKRHLISASKDKSRLDHYDYTDQTLWFGPALAWAPASSRLSVGAGLYGIYRDLSISQSLWQKDGTALDAACDLKTLGILAAVGAQYDLGNDWHAGATIQSPNFCIYDEGALSLGAYMPGEHTDGLNLGIHSKDVDADNYIPWQLGLGIGRTVEKKWGFALDATYHPSDSFDYMTWNFDGNKLNERMRMRQVLDVSLGGEYFIAERYPVRAGVYTAFSSVRLPKEGEDSSFTTSDVDMYGITLSVGRCDDNMSVNIGLDYAFGHGHDLSYSDDGDLTRNSCDRNVLLATISTTYYF